MPKISRNNFAIDATGKGVDTLPKNTEFKIRANQMFTHGLPRPDKYAETFVSAFDYGEGVEHTLEADGPAAYGVILTGTFEQCLAEVPDEAKLKLHKVS